MNSKRTPTTFIKCPHCGYILPDGHAIAMTCDQSNYICNKCHKQWERSTFDDKDMVNSPQHYADHYPVEVIDMIKQIFKLIFGEDWKIAFDGYMLGNELKYRLRAGFKHEDKIVEDIQKSLWYNKARRGEQ